MAQKSPAYFHVHGFTRAPVYLRITAIFIDALIALLPWLIITPLWRVSPFRLSGQFGLLQGFIVGAALLWSFYYICFRDGYPQGQSIGKRCMGLMVVGTQSNQPCTPLQSFVRNVLGCFKYIILAEVIILSANLRTGRRLGDFLAQTMVIAASQFTPRKLR